MNRLLLSIFLITTSLSCFADQNIDPRAEEVLTYWFGNIKTPEDYPEKNKIWFSGGQSVDHDIRDRFENLVIQASEHKLDSWNETAKGRLALIILLDQFPRNIYRGSPDAFYFDCLASQFALEGIKLNQDKELFPIERAFFYLPLEHSENLEIQKISIKKFAELKNQAPQSLSSIFESYEKYALQHYKIIEKFGRFPHRNATLNRQSTVQELEFLKGPNSSF